MNKKAQTLMISLWILAILTVLAVGIGHRVSLSLRISRYQKDSLKAWGLAKAGLNLAIRQIQKDTNDYDSLDEAWADDQTLFKRITLSPDPDQFAVVSHVRRNEEDKPVDIFGASDAESRININKASKEVLQALLEKFAINPAEDTVNSILIWRGDAQDSGKIYDTLGYPAKGAFFQRIEEMNLVKGFNPADFEKIRGLVTVYGDGAVNLNTVSLDALRAVCRGAAKKLGVDENFADSVAAKIAELRTGRGHFKDKAEIDIMLTGDEETNIFNELMSVASLRSQYFLIEVTGNSSRIKRKIEAVYDRKEKKIREWHES